MKMNLEIFPIGVVEKDDVLSLQSSRRDVEWQWKEKPEDNYSLY